MSSLAYRVGVTVLFLASLTLLSCVSELHRLGSFVRAQLSCLLVSDAAFLWGDYFPGDFLVARPAHRCTNKSLGSPDCWFNARKCWPERMVESATGATYAGEKCGWRASWWDRHGFNRRVLGKPRRGVSRVINLRASERVAGKEDQQQRRGTRAGGTAATGGGCGRVKLAGWEKKGSSKGRNEWEWEAR